MEQERQSLAQRVTAALSELNGCQTRLEMQAQARRIQSVFPAALILDAVVKALPAANGRLRGGLGLLAQLLPREQAEQALLRVVLNKRFSSHARLSAVTILQDYLDRPVEQAFIQDIADSESVILTSMREALAARAEYPAVLVEYASQFAQLETGHRRWVLRLLHRLPEDDAAALLYAMAFNRAANVAADAIEFLESLSSPRAQKTLYVLSQSLYKDPALEAKARGGLRRLRLRGEDSFWPQAAPTDAQARFLGFAPEGTLNVALSFPRQAFELHIGYDAAAGITSMQKRPYAASAVPSQTVASVSLASDSPGANDRVLPLDWIRWHLSHTLASRPAPDDSGPYLDMYQALASELWSWQMPEVPSRVSRLLRDDDRQAPEEPSVVYQGIRDLPPTQLLRQLLAWRSAKPTRGRNDALAERDYVVWWLQAKALLDLAARNENAAQRWAQAARLAAQDSPAAEEFMRTLTLRPQSTSPPA